MAPTKYPKLVGSLNGATSQGLSDFRALGDTGAPYLTTAGPGYVTRKKGEFGEVVLDEPAAQTEPYLWGVCWRAVPAEVVVQTIEPVSHRARTVLLVSIPHPDGNELAYGHALWVGDGRIFAMEQSTPSSLIDTQYWPVLYTPTNGVEVAPSDPAASTRAISLIASATSPWYPRSMFATGWMDDASRYGFGYSFMAGISDILAALNHDPAQNNIPYAVMSNTGTYSVSTVTLPHETTRAHYGGRIFCVGPGKLLALIAVSEQRRILPADAGYPDDGYAVKYLPQVAPYFCWSDDHGATWTRADATFLTSLLTTLTPMEVGSRDGYYNSQLDHMFWETTATYVGGGKSIVTMRDGVFSTGHHCWLYDNAAHTFTPLTWPVTTGLDGGFVLSIADNSLYASSMSWCYAPGCFVWWAENGANRRALFTEDYGATWTLSAPTPFATTQPPTILAPNKMLFTAHRSDNTGSDVWQTGGGFTKHRKLGTAFSKVVMNPADNESLGGFLVQYLRRTHVRPELGNEFDKP